MQHGCTMYKPNAYSHALKNATHNNTPTINKARIKECAAMFRSPRFQSEKPDRENQITRAKAPAIATHLS